MAPHISVYETLLQLLALAFSQQRRITLIAQDTIAENGSTPTAF
ncbi:hypothetical protein [Rhodococcus sp. 24CO]